MIQNRIAKLWEHAMAAEPREDWSTAKRLYRKVVDAVRTRTATFQRLGLIALRAGRPNELGAVHPFEGDLDSAGRLDSEGQS
ncbi:MAG: hypothetical protein V3V86_00885 [Gammaproteobacteria bacterium]|jgi:hypothetical protein